LAGVFVYLDDVLLQYYDYNNSSQETTFDRPPDSLLLDPETVKLFMFPSEAPAPQPELEPPPRPEPAQSPRISVQPQNVARARLAHLSLIKPPDYSFPISDPTGSAP
jgi:hypothetical protein